MQQAQEWCIRWLSLSLVACVALSCSGGGDDDGPATGQTGPVASDNFVTQLASALCGNVGGCCQEAGLGYDRAACETALEALYGGLLAAVTSSADFDPVLAGECVEQVRTDAASCALHNLGGEACADVFAGVFADPRGEGEACGQSCERTMSGTNCYIHGSDSGECYREEGLYCEPTTLVCTRLVSNGAECTVSEACENGYCDSGACAAPLAEGGDCGFEDEACADGLICSAASGQCSPRAANGVPCFFEEDCMSDYCAPDGTCADASEAPSLLLASACTG